MYKYNTENDFGMVGKNHKTRREALKATGISLAGLGSTGLVHAKDEREIPTRVQKLLRAARKILRNQGPEARAQFLRKHGVKSTYKGGTVSLPDDTSGGGSTNDVDCIEPTKDCNGEIEVNISIDYFSSSDNYNVSLQARYKYAYDMYITGSMYYDGPQNPKDGMGLYWNADEYQITNPDKPAQSMSPPEHGSWDNGSWINGQNGTGFRINDKKVCQNTGLTKTRTDKKWSNWDSCGVTLDPESQHTDSSEVYGEYIYTWNEQNVTVGVGASYPAGVSVSVSGSTTMKKEDIGTNLNGGSLIVHGYEG